MFTGIVREIGTVTSVERARRGAVLRIDLGALGRGLRLGDSVAVDGVCLTVAARRGRVAEFHAVPETLRRTTLGGLREGDPVNLEPALRAGEPLGGHFVQGHVDGTATLVSLEKAPSRPVSYTARFRSARALTDQMAEKGSVAIDGTSLTLVDVRPGAFSIALVPHTMRRTTFGRLSPPRDVNVELDILGKYVRQALRQSRR